MILVLRACTSLSPLFRVDGPILLRDKLYIHTVFTPSCRSRRCPRSSRQPRASSGKYGAGIAASRRLGVVAASGSSPTISLPRTTTRSSPARNTTFTPGWFFSNAARRLATCSSARNPSTATRTVSPARNRTPVPTMTRTSNRRRNHDRKRFMMGEPPSRPAPLPGVGHRRMHPCELGSRQDRAKYLGSPSPKTDQRA